MKIADTQRAVPAPLIRKTVNAIIQRTKAHKNNAPVPHNIGKVYYFADGTQVNNWKKIDGKWYYFYADGAMAVNTKIGNYEIGTDGARKLFILSI